MNCFLLFFVSIVGCIQTPSERDLEKSIKRISYLAGVQEGMLISDLESEFGKFDSKVSIGEHLISIDKNNGGGLVQSYELAIKKVPNVDMNFSMMSENTETTLENLKQKLTDREIMLLCLFDGVVTRVPLPEKLSERPPIEPEERFEDASLAFFSQSTIGFIHADGCIWCFIVKNGKVVKNLGLRNPSFLFVD